MFTLPVGDLLSSYTGDSREFSFDGPIFDGYYEDIRFLGPLRFDVRIMTLDDGVHVSWSHLDTRVEYEGSPHDISLQDFDRTWKLHIDPLSDADDVMEISKNMSIDLAPVIREEIIMACHEL